VKGNAACAGDRPLLSAANPPGECVLLDALWVWAAPLHSTRPEAAERFAAWLMSEEGSRAWNAGGGYPVLMESGTCFQTAFPAAADPDALYALVGALAAPNVAETPSTADQSARLDQAQRAAQAEIRRQGISMPIQD
jgi:ABC-type glycerol-3-phosphate transport system substrate-binding protein